MFVFLYKILLTNKRMFDIMKKTNVREHTFEHDLLNGGILYG